MAGSLPESQELDTEGGFGQHVFTFRVAKHFDNYTKYLEYINSDEAISGRNMNTGEIPVHPDTKKLIEELRERKGKKWGTAAANEFSSDFMRYTFRDTSLGGNDAINCYYSYCENDDIIHQNTDLNAQSNGPKGLYGLGRVYAEQINANQQIMYLSFGTAEFKGLTDFTSEAVDSGLERLMNNGDWSGVAKFTGRILGSAAGLIVNIPFIPFKFMSWVFSKAKTMQKVEITKYCDFKTDMVTYYAMVNLILAHLAVNMEILDADGDAGKGSTVDTGSQLMSGSYMQMQREQAFENNEFDVPYIYKNGIDIFTILLKKYRFNADFKKTFKNMPYTTPALISAYKTVWAKWHGENGKAGIHNESKEVTIPSTKEGEEGKSVLISGLKRNKNSKKANGDSTGTDFGASSYVGLDAWDQLMSGWQVGIHEAANFVGFRVEKNLDTNESISNSTGETQIGGFINSQANAGIDRRGLFNGEIDIPFFKQAADIISEFIKGATDSVDLSAIGTIVTGGGRFEIPEIWKDSSFNRPYSMNIPLRSPLGDSISILYSIYVPLALILAGVLPRAIGKSAYTSPFYCSVYCKGMISLPFAMIDNVTLRRGKSQHGWNHSMLPTAIDVSLSFKDLSPAMYVALADGVQWHNIIGQNSNFQHYMLTLSGATIAERVYMLPRGEKRLKQLKHLFLKYKNNPLRIGMSLSNTTIGNLATAISKGHIGEYGAGEQYLGEFSRNNQ